MKVNIFTRFPSRNISTAVSLLLNVVRNRDTVLSGDDEIDLLPGELCFDDEVLVFLCFYFTGSSSLYESELLPEEDDEEEAERFLFLLALYYD